MTTSDPIAPTTPIDAVLTDEMLARFDERAPQYDRENRFFDEDFAELRASGYLSCALPVEYGGSGLGLLGYTQLARRLGVRRPGHRAGREHARLLDRARRRPRRMGDDSCRFVLEQAAEGKIFAAIHGEAGNDMPLLLSTTAAERVDGGWEISGHKIFGSLTPVWTYGGFHAMDTSDPEHPQIVHGFLARDTAGHRDRRHVGHARHAGDAEPGHGARQGVLPGRAVPGRVPGRLRRRRPVPRRRSSPGRSPASPPSTSARPAGPTTSRSTKMPTRTSIALTGSMANHPEVQHHVAKMRMALDAAEALLDRTAGDWEAGVQHADWPVRLVANRQVVINAANDVVDRALDLSGGAGGVPGQPARADLPRRADGPLPPGQPAAGAGADRQALPGRRPRPHARAGAERRRQPPPLFCNSLVAHRDWRRRWTCARCATRRTVSRWSARWRFPPAGGRTRRCSSPTRGPGSTTCSGPGQLTSPRSATSASPSTTTAG